MNGSLSKMSLNTPISRIDNPLTHLDYLIELNYEPSDTHSIRLRYIPDHDLFDENAFNAYCQKVIKSVKSFEEILPQLHHDINNEILPRFLQIIVKSTTGQLITLEDKQPGWHNTGFLDRLERF